MAEDVKPGGEPKKSEGDLEARVKALETRLNKLLSGQTELKVEELAVAPRSKLRVACE